jgi:PST family polysaccharide transporter
MASRRQAALGTIWGVVERASTQGISFVVVVVLARYLGPQTFGLVTLAATIALFGQTLIGETFSQAMVQAKLLEPEHVAAIFWMLLTAATGGALLLAGFAHQVAGIFSQPHLAPILMALSPLLVLTALQAVPTALFKRDMDFRSLAVASTSGTLAGGVVGIGMAISGYGPWSLVANLLVQNVVVTITIWRRAKFQVTRRYSHSHLKQLWDFGQYTFLLRIAAFTANQGPRILVGYLFGPAALGAFSLGLRIVEIMLQLLALPVSNVTISMVSRIRHDSAKLERAISGATQLTAMIAIPAFLMVALVAPVGVPLLFGHHWAQSVAIVQILAVASAFGANGMIYLGVLTGLGRPDLNLAMTTGAAIASVVLLVLVAPFGIVAATAAFVLRSLASAPIVMRLIGKITGIRPGGFYTVYAPVIAACIPMVVLVGALMRWGGAYLSPPALACAALAVGLAAYAAGLSLFGRPALKLGIATVSDLRPSQRPA